jgi:hypothetical protein
MLFGRALGRCRHPIELEEERKKREENVGGSYSESEFTWRQ